MPEPREIVMAIEGHDWRYTGDGWAWTDQGEGWDRMKRVGFQRKECITCGYIGEPDDEVRPCNELWTERTGHPSSIAAGSPIYRVREPAL